VSVPPQLVHVDLEFVVGSDPIRGRIGSRAPLTREFQGWIELAAALEALIGQSRPPEVAEGLRSAGGA
jgi:hypothetical protein